MSDKESNMSVYIIILVILVIISTLWIFYSSRNWEEISGHIYRIEVEKIHNDTISSMSKNKKFTEYKINLEYTYSINGKKYKGTRFYPLLPNVFSDKEYANELMSKFKQGQKTSVYYNPNSPATSCLITSKNISIAKYSLMAFILLIFFAVFITAFKYFNKLF